MYDKECERKKCPTPKEDRTTKYLLSIKENIISGQVGLYIPPNKSSLEIPFGYLTATHIDNPLWINYDFINGENSFVIGSFISQGRNVFGAGFVDPFENRKILEGNYSYDLIQQVRESSRKYTLQVHNKCSHLINDVLRKPDIKEQLLQRIDSELFEELVADLLRDNGFDVFLTSRTADGGKDIWATTIVNGKPLTALVECKVRSSKKAIDPALARAVVGTFFIEKAKENNVDCAILVTSSDNIGPETLMIQQKIREFSVKDCNDVVSWINRYGSMKNGLWVPSYLSDFLL